MWETVRWLAARTAYPWAVWRGERTHGGGQSRCGRRHLRWWSMPVITRELVARIQAAIEQVTVRLEVEAEGAEGNQPLTQPVPSKPSSSSPRRSPLPPASCGGVPDRLALSARPRAVALADAGAQAR